MNNADNNRFFHKQMTLIGICLLLQEILFFASAYAFSWFLYPYLDDVLPEVDAYVFESLLDGACYMVAFIFPAAVLRKGGVPTQGIPYRPNVTAKVFLYVPAAAALICVFSVINAAIMPNFYHDFSGQVLWNDTAETNFQLVLSFITSALIPGVCEEYLFRGAIQTSLRPFGRQISIIGTALLFGLMHANAGQFFYAFCAGIVLGLLRDKSNSLWPGTLVHIFNNAISVVEGAMADRMATEVSDMVLYAVEAFIFCIGFICILLLFRSAVIEQKNKKDALESGNFGLLLPTAPQYTPYPVQGNVLRLSLNVPMIFFLLVAIGRAVLFFGMAYLGNY